MDKDQKKRTGRGRHRRNVSQAVVKACILFWLPGCAVHHIQVASTAHYTVQNAHSHNDYVQPHFFSDAYRARFGSMEADIFLIDGQLLVAHNKAEADRRRTLAGMYLEPLASHIRANGGYPYADRQDQLELLIDLKDPPGSPSYEKAVALIRSYAALAHARHLRFTFTGNIPSDAVMAVAGRSFYFDGVPGRSYTKAALRKIYMLSDNFAHYSDWKGEGKISDSDYQKLRKVVEAVHKEGKKVRFWNAPDNPAAWRLMESLGVDYINTDKIAELANALD